MFGVLCAIPEELEALRAVLPLDPQPTRHGPSEVWTGSWAGRPLCLARSGIGKVQAAAAATLLLSRFGATSLVFSGVAGGLDPRHAVGAVLLGERLGIVDYGIVTDGSLTPTQSGGVPIGAPRLNRLEAVQPAVHARLVALGEAAAPRLAHPIVLGGILTADYFLNCPATRDVLHADFSADAIDMESGAVDQVARAWGAPLHVIRTLSDLAGKDSHISFEQMADMASGHSALCVPLLLDLIAAEAAYDPGTTRSTLPSSASVNR